MRVFILASGRPFITDWKPTPVWHLIKYVNKSLIPINEGGQTILDSQIELLLKNGLSDIHIIVGYRAEEIFQYCREKGYDVRYVLDPNWESGAISSGRTLWDIQEELLTASYPIITIYNDIVFNQKTLDELLQAKGNVCCVQNSQNIIKWDVAGIRELLCVLEDEECRYNHDGLSYPTWGKLKWNKNIIFTNVTGGQMINVNNPDQWVPLASPKIVNQFLEEIKQKHNLPQNTRLGF